MTRDDRGLLQALVGDGRPLLLFSGLSLVLSGVFALFLGFAAAIGVHPIVGYNDIFHLAPAILGAIMFIVGLALCWKPMQSIKVAEPLGE